MTQFIQAIYVDGVLKPLEPLALPEQARVKLTVDAEAAPPLTTTPADGAVAAPIESEVLTRQQAALEELRKAVDQLPQVRNNDGWSVRQHDELLYGGNK